MTPDSLVAEIEQAAAEVKRLEAEQAALTAERQQIVARALDSARRESVTGMVDTAAITQKCSEMSARERELPALLLGARLRHSRLRIEHLSRQAEALGEPYRQAYEAERQAKAALEAAQSHYEAAAQHLRDVEGEQTSYVRSQANEMSRAAALEAEYRQALERLAK